MLCAAIVADAQQEKLLTKVTSEYPLYAHKKCLYPSVWRVKVYGKCMCSSGGGDMQLCVECKGEAVTVSSYGLPVVVLVVEYRPGCHGV